MTNLLAEARGKSTKGDRNRLRQQGKVPGVVYGKALSGVTIAIDQKELLQLLRTNPNSVIDLQLPEQGKQSVMIAEVQRHSISRELLHVDFHQINMDEPITTAVRINYNGEASGVKEGGILQVQLHELEVRCLPRELPASIDADISTLAIGDSLLAGDIALPSGVELKMDPNELAVTILLPQKEAEPEQMDTEPASKVEGEFEKKGQAAPETV